MRPGLSALAQAFIYVKSMTSIAAIQREIKLAGEQRRPLRIVGSGSKDFYAHRLDGEPFDVRGYSGIVKYEPEELVVTACCGTPLAEIEAALAERRQMLAFEAPYFDTGTTLGGAVAAGFSGPGRAYYGALRDFVLGTRVIDGLGNLLKFGGQVMKNVAGFDASRLLTGSFGTLGVIAEVSLKVVPQAPFRATLQLEKNEHDFIIMTNKLAGEPLPISATYFQAGVARIRLSGTQASVNAARRKIGGELVADDAPFWIALRDHLLEFFQDREPLWRLSLPQTTPPLQLGDSLIEWGGGLRWLKSSEPAEAIREIVKKAGGSATLFRNAPSHLARLAPLEPAVLRLHQRLKQSFDPLGILNPGRLWPETASAHAN